MDRKTILIQQDNGLDQGSSTSAIYAGGNASSTKVKNVETWDGSSWTEVGEI